MKKVIVTEDCICCGACFGIEESVFSPNEEGMSICNNANINAENIENVEVAMSACPVNAIIEVEESEMSA